MFKKISNRYGETRIGGSKEEHEIDFRVPGLSHAVVKEAEHLRVQELVKKIENHPHREARHADLQQNNVYNPFSKHSKDAWKRCCKKVDSQGEQFTGIHDRFFRDPVYRESQLAIGWTEQKCKEWTNLRKKTTRTISLQRNSKDTQGQWDLTLNKSGKNGPMKLRSDFQAAVLMKNRLYHESGEQVEEPIHPDQYRRFFSFLFLLLFVLVVNEQKEFRFQSFK